MVPCPGRVLRYQGERLRAADHVASSSAAVKDVSRLRLPVRRTRYFRWACRGLSETPRGSSLDEWAAAERVLVQFLALPVLPGAASTTSGPPRRAPSWRICAVQTDTREHHAAHVAGWSRTSTSASLSTCAGGKFSFERPSSCRSRSAGRRVEVGGTTTSELFRRGAPVEARWAGLCSTARLATAFSRGQGLGSADRLRPLQFRSSETPSYCTAAGSWTTPFGARGTPCTTGSAVQNGSTTDDSHVLFSTGRLGLFQLQRWARRGRRLCSVPLRRCRPVRVSGAGVFSASALLRRFPLL